MRLHSAAAIALLLPAAIAVAQQPVAAKHAFTPEDWYKVTTVSAPSLSPDGGKVALTVTTVREAENKRHSEIWIVPTAGGSAMRYTSPSFESSNARFSEDGKILYFTSQRPETRGQSWALRMDEPSGEAYQPSGPQRVLNGWQPANRWLSSIMPISDVSPCKRCSSTSLNTAG